MQALPSKKNLLISTAIAVVAAIAILLMVVLPAEYGIDPTRMGTVLGLTAMGESKAVAAMSNGGAIVYHAHERSPRTVRIEISVKPHEELEYKATLPQGEPLLYSWSVKGGAVYSEFHGDPTEGKWPKDYFRSYEIKEKTTAEQGSFVAPFAGRHGWYWRNLSSEPLTITLEVSGYFSKIGRI